MAGCSERPGSAGEVGLKVAGLEAEVWLLSIALGQRLKVVVRNPTDKAGGL
jgi:hypothetical protein